jgi:hypothetical protein
MERAIIPQFLRPFGQCQYAQRSSDTQKPGTNPGLLRTCCANSSHSWPLSAGFQLLTFSAMLRGNAVRSASAVSALDLTSLNAAGAHA